MESKKRRLVADTADDLQHILFGDMDQGDTDAFDVDQAILPVDSGEVEQVETYSDSDRDSMDEFIVRDTNEAKEHRFIQNYSDRYGEDVGEAITDVIAVFGDLRILDMYSRDVSKISRLVPEIRHDVTEDLHKSILETDCSERVQMSPLRLSVLESLNAFEFDKTEIVEKFESDWAIESRWVYSVMFERYSRGGHKLDLDVSHSAVLLPEHASTLISRIHVFLRDFKGRGFDPLYIWHSMSRAKYNWYLNLDDLFFIQKLDLEWSTVVGPKYLRVAEKLDTFLHATDNDENPLVLSVRSEITNLKTELNFFINEGMSWEFSNTLDDYNLTLSAELEPVLVFSSKNFTATKTSRKIRAPKSAIGRLIEKSLHETVLPVLSLSPREIGENLQVGARIHKGPEMPVPTVGVVDRSLLCDFLSSCVSSNVKVRSWFRRQIAHRVCITTCPVGGMCSVSDKYYGVRRLCMRPVHTMYGSDVYLKILTLFKSGEISMDVQILGEDGKLLIEATSENIDINKLLGGKDKDSLLLDVDDADNEEDISGIMRTIELKRKMGCHSSMFVCEDFLLKELLHYMTPEVVDCDWLTDLRLSVAKSIIKKLYVSIKSEIISDLFADNLQSALKCAQIELFKIGQMRPFEALLTIEGMNISETRLVEKIRNKALIFEILSRKMKSPCTVMSCVLEKVSNGFRTHVHVLNRKGDLVESVQLDHLLNKWANKYEAERTTVVRLIKENMPGLVVVGATDKKSRILFAEMQKCAEYCYHDDGGYKETEFSKYLQPPHVCMSETTWANSSNVGLSLGRFQQNALAEVLSLSVLPALTPFQSFITASMNHLVSECASRIVAEFGVDLNEIKSSEHRSILLEYVPGLGPQTARKIIDSAAGTDLAQIVGNRRFINAQPFIKVIPQVDRVLKILLGEIDDASNDDDSMSSESSDESSSSDEEENSTWVAPVDVAEWTKAAEGNRVAPAVEAPAASPGKWTKDADGKWVAPVVSVPAAPSGEWTKDAESNWVAPVSAAPVAAEWTKDAEGNWVAPVAAAPAASSGEWIKDADGKWVAPAGETPAASSGEWTKDANGKWVAPVGPTVAPVARPYFGISNKLVRRCMVGRSYFELCRFSKECWPVARALGYEADAYSEMLGSTSEEVSSGYSELIDAMFDTTNVPPHLCDAEVDIAYLKLAAQSVISTLIIPQLRAPFGGAGIEWSSSGASAIFYSCVHENPSEFNQLSAVTASVKSFGKKNQVYLAEVGTGIEGALTRGYQDYSDYTEGDSVHCRIASIEFEKFSLTFTTEPLSDSEMAQFRQDFFVTEQSDFDRLRIGLGKVVPLAVTDTLRTQLKTRRIIKHESYFEVSHAVAVSKLSEMSVGDVLFRPSSSHPGIYFGLVKIKPLTDSIDPSREDWIKTFRFTQVVGGFRLPNGEEFEEFDQIKVLVVEKYLKNLHELMGNSKFRPETIERVSNMIKAKSMTQTGVSYAFVMDPRRQFSGNAILLWSFNQVVYQDNFEITHKGFKWWTKGPYKSVNDFIIWWKQGGYRERSKLIAEWIDQRGTGGSKTNDTANERKTNDTSGEWKSNTNASGEWKSNNDSWRSNTDGSTSQWTGQSGGQWNKDSEQTSGQWNRDSSAEWKNDSWNKSSNWQDKKW